MVAGDVSPETVKIRFPGFYGTPLYAEMQNGRVKTMEGDHGHYDDYQERNPGDLIAEWDTNTEELIAGEWTGSGYAYLSGDGKQVTSMTYMCVKSASTYGNPGAMLDGIYPWAQLNLNAPPATSKAIR